MTVYVIQCQQTYNVKIGYTSRLVQSRLTELRTAASTPIELVKWYPRYSEADERQLHETFAKYRVTGEWFKSDVLTLIDHEIEAMGLIGERDYEAIAFNGSIVAPAVMTVSVAVLKIGTQNMKQAFFEQLPEEVGFTCDAKHSYWYKESISDDFTGIACTGYWPDRKVYEVIESTNIIQLKKGSLLERPNKENDFKAKYEEIKEIVEGFFCHSIEESSVEKVFVAKKEIRELYSPPEKADIVLSPGRMWGMVDIPIKHYGNVSGHKRYWLFEDDGQLVKRTFEDIDKFQELAPNYTQILDTLNTAQQLFLI